MQRLIPQPTTQISVQEMYATMPGEFCRLCFISSADGASSVEGTSRGLGSPTDRAVIGELRNWADAVVVGAVTAVREDYRPLVPASEWVRRRVEQGRKQVPPLVVVTNRIDFGPDASVFSYMEAKTIVVVPASADPGRLAAIEPVADIITAGDERVDMAAMIRALHERGYEHITCEGGPRMATAMIDAGVVDELCLTYSPTLVGPGPDRILSGHELAAPLRLTLTHLAEHNGFLFARYALGRK